MIIILACFVNKVFGDVAGLYLSKALTSLRWKYTSLHLIKDIKLRNIASYDRHSTVKCVSEYA